MLGILSFSDRKRALRSLTEISELTFVVKKSTIMLSRVSIFREWARKLRIKCRSNLKLYTIIFQGDVGPPGTPGEEGSNGLPVR